MSEHERQFQDDELDVEELEEVAGGDQLEDTINHCPITNYSQCNAQANP